MMRKILIALLAALMLCSCAHADNFSGTVAAAYTEATAIPSGVTVNEVFAKVGDRIESGDALCSLRTHTVFCEEDGYVSIIYAESGEEFNGTVLEVFPRHFYHLYCSTDNAYDSPDCRWIQAGETLYVKCTTDGTHRAIATVYSIDGEDFEAYSTAGELFIGETVNLYRSSDFSAYSRVGVATVVASDTHSYETQGYIMSVDVETGETVSRGEKLYTWCETDSSEIIAETSGIISEINVEDGKSPQGTVAAQIIPDDALRLELVVNEMELNSIRNGGITYIRADDPTETPKSARLDSVSSLLNEEGFRIWLIPEEKNLPIGLSVKIEIP